MFSLWQSPVNQQTFPPKSPDFRDEVHPARLEIIDDGTWQEIYNQWFPSPPPWTLEEMLNTPHNQ